MVKIWYQKNAYKPPPLPNSGLGCCLGGGSVVDSLFIVAPIFCGGLFCIVVLINLSRFAMILMGKRAGCFNFNCLPDVL